MRIGVTGTRNGANENQLDSIKEFLFKVKEEYSTVELHHGDCVGVDVEVAEMAKAIGYHIVCHPPSKQDLRAYHDSDDFRPEYSYFVRNRNIVDGTDVLIVVPKQNEWQPRGGTWYTASYAKKKNKPVIVFYPNLI